jgi:hypothetical protein
MEATITIMRLNVSEARVISRAILFFSAISVATTVTSLLSGLFLAAPVLSQARAAVVIEPACVSRCG